MTLPFPALGPRACRGVLAAVVTSVALGLAAAPAAEARSHPLQTALTGVPDTPLAYQQTRGAGTSVIRLFLGWQDIAPKGDTKPAGFDPSNPDDPQYDWSYPDYVVGLAVANGLEPFVTIEGTPTWAQQPNGSASNQPNADEFGKFMHAAAERYSGTHNGLPRVRYWEAWSEPNNYRDLNPQWDGTHWPPPSPLPAVAIYRQLLGAFADSVHGVHPDNIVVAGGLAPFTGQPQIPITPPLQFMRDLLCVSPKDRPLPTCQPVHFDAWAHNPYTSGDPEHHAASKLDVSLGDLPEMKRVLDVGVRAGHAVPSNGHMRFVVTEFSWDTNPPDNTAVPMKLHERWVSEALYRMYQVGIDLVTWFRLRDDPQNGLPPAALFQSGLYFACQDESTGCPRKKPSFESFRFPFVAYTQGRGILVWGRTPFGRPGRVAVEQGSGKHWKSLAILRADANGIFTRKLRSNSLKGQVRARLLGTNETGNPFSLKRPKDLLVNPFGGAINQGGRNF